MAHVIKSKGEKAFDVLNIAVMCIVAFMTLYPFYNIFILSINDPIDAMRGGIYFWPRIFSFSNYAVVFSDNTIIRAAIVTVSRTLLGTFTGVFFTAGFAYAMAKKDLLGRKYLMIFMIITMYFSGGLIPGYLLIKELHLMKNFLVYIIPHMFSAWNAIIMITFFKGISKEFEESARMDGANDLIIFIRLIIPVSTPVLATMALFNGVSHWNAWFDAMLYGGQKLQTLQQILVRIINTMSDVSATAANMGMKKTTSQSVKLATMVVTVVPIVFSYPFLQRYFIKGIMIGSLKG